MNPQQEELVQKFYDAEQCDSQSIWKFARELVALPTDEAIELRRALRETDISLRRRIHETLFPTTVTDWPGFAREYMALNRNGKILGDLPDLPRCGVGSNASNEVCLLFEGHEPFKPDRFHWFAALGQ